MDYLQYEDAKKEFKKSFDSVLNLIINGLPSIHGKENKLEIIWEMVLNLIINGLPSIRNGR